MSALTGIQAHKEAGDRLFRNGKQKLAISSYDRAIEASEQSQCPDLLAVLYSNRSAAKLVLKDYQGALADAQSSVAVDDKWIKGWYRSAKALQGLGKTQLALQAAHQALQLEPHNKDVVALVGELSAAASSKTHTSSNSPPRYHPQQQPQQEQGQEQQQQQQQPRAHLDPQLLPQQLVAGSRHLASPDGVNSNLLLLMHGLGDQPSAFTALAQRMQLPQTACLALSGPLVVPETGGGRAWFQAFDDDWNLIQANSHEKRRLVSLAATLQLLKQLLSALSAAGGWQPSQVQLLGFSQGGTVALELARRCTGSRRLGGVVAISASLLEEGLTEPSSSSGVTATTAASQSDGQGCDVLITHGDCDDVVPRQLVKRSMTALQQSGCSVELHSLPGKGHAMVGSPGEMRLLMAFWGKHLQSRPSDPAFVEVPGRFPDADTAAAAAASAAAAGRQAMV